MKLSEILKKKITENGELRLDPLDTRLAIEWLELLEERSGVTFETMKTLSKIMEEKK